MGVMQTGRTVTTRPLISWAADHEDRLVWLIECLSRHAGGDWGNLDPADRAANAAAVHHGSGRVLSVYPIPAQLAGGNADPTIWIITDDVGDPDTATTCLWPSEY